MASQRHIEFVPFVLDLLDFVEEKIGEAVADEASRPGAVGEAAGALPLLRDRLRGRSRKAGDAPYSDGYRFCLERPDSQPRSSPSATRDRFVSSRIAAILASLITVSSMMTVSGRLPAGARGPG